MRESMSDHGYTQVQVAERLGIKQSSFNQMLNRRYGRIPESLLRALDALNLKLTVEPKER